MKTVHKYRYLTYLSDICNDKFSLKLVNTSQTCQDIFHIHWWFFNSIISLKNVKTAKSCLYHRSFLNPLVKSTFGIVQETWISPLIRVCYVSSSCSGSGKWLKDSVNKTVCCCYSSVLGGKTSLHDILLTLNCHSSRASYLRGIYGHYEFQLYMYWVWDCYGIKNHHLETSIWSILI